MAETNQRVRNPNPRIWRQGVLIVDLERVALAMRSTTANPPTDPHLLIYLDGIDSPIRIGADDATIESLVNALEIYRSER